MTDVAEILWPEERVALRPPEDISVSEWAARHRELAPEHHGHSGPLDPSITPYTIEIVDALRSRVERITMMGSTQWGKTMTLETQLLWTIACDPVPVLYVLPTEEDAKSFNNHRFKASLKLCPPARAQMSSRAHDQKTSERAFDGMVLTFAWANSPSRLSSRSIGRLWLDEVDKYPPFAGKEADPIALASERTRWFQDAKTVLASTPTTTNGYIWRSWEKSDKRWFHVPCPHCGEYQPLKFSKETVRWPEDERDPDRIRDQRLAWMVCVHCEERIDDTDENKQAMLLAGVWCPEGGHVDAVTRQAQGVRLDSSHRGYHVNALYSPMLTWSDVAAKFLECKDDHGDMMGFTNSWLGWPWIEQATAITLDQLRARAIELPRAIVPANALVLTAGVDVQEHWLYWSIRAHAIGESSTTILYGRFQGDEWDKLAAVLFETAYEKPGENGDPLMVRLAAIDSQYRTDQCYRFCAQFAHAARPLKCHQHRTIPFSPTKIERDWLGRSGGLLLWNLDVSYFKDKLARQILKPLGEDGSWSCHADPDEGYLAQVHGEHKVLVRSPKTRRVSMEWVPRPGAPGNHWWDCEVYNAAAAEMLGLYALRPTVTETGRALLTGEKSVAPPRTAKVSVDRSRIRMRRGGSSDRGKRGGGWIRRR